MGKSKDNTGYIFRPWIKTKNGCIIHAKNYGLKAFKIPVSNPAKD